MKTILLITGISTLPLLIAPSLADARPSPDRPGICYFFQGATLKLSQPCVISAGYGAGAHYAVLNWQDGVKTNIVKQNYCLKQNFDVDGFCQYTVDQEVAVSYSRNGAMQPTMTQSEKNIECYKVQKTGNSVCYRIE